ncbi:hypothetical protein ACLB2K_044764 [Fragaria x ananassa]
MSGCFPAPAVISGAAITQIVWGRRTYPVSQFSIFSSTSSWFVYNHSKHYDRRRRRRLSISEKRRALYGVGVSLQQQWDCESENERREDNEWVVVNFYQFVMIEDAEGEVAKHLRFLEGLDIRGRIYVNEQGINAQYSGPRRDAVAYVEWVREDERFADVLVQISAAPNGHAFPKLKLRYKPSLVQLEGGISHLPLLDPAMRATPLAPSEWRKRLETVNTADAATQSPNADYILLDVRNGYEWDIGHFSGARRPDVDCFRSTSFGLSQPEVIDADPLADVDKETDILMYCTGGIRCDVYSTILRQQGFQNVYTLKGGVSHYLKNEGSVKWVGNLFVFDSRLSLPPDTYKPEAITKPSRVEDEVSENNTFARCYICGLQVCELRHRNCANLDCNLLHLCCMNCVENLRGCCCSKCTTAPRLRPVLQGPHRYEKWHRYRDLTSQTKSTV